MEQPPLWTQGDPETQNSGGNGKTRVRWLLHIIIAGMCCMMGAAGGLSLVSISESSSPVSDFFVGVYVMLFAALLFTHELNEIHSISWLEHFLKHNLGFLFKPLGKGLFIVFIAFLNLGLSNSNNLGLATGICLALIGIGYIVLYLRNPEYFDESPSASATNKGYEHPSTDAGHYEGV